MAEHTKLPWHVNHDRPDDDTSQLSISNGDARIIANVVTRKSTHGFEGGSANAAFIVKAVNNHDALIESLEEFVSMFGPTIVPGSIGDEVFQKAKGALAPVKGASQP